jgi:hypothetical protein
MNLELARAVADAVLYEGYLLYPYRSTSSKNQSRWQFGVVGPPGAAERGLGEASSMALQTVVSNSASRESTHAPCLVVHLRFLQLQRRQLYDENGTAVDQLDFGGASWVSWDEAVEQEVEVTLDLDALTAGTTVPEKVPATVEAEPLTAGDGAEAGRVVRRTWPLSAELSATVRPHGDHAVLELEVHNVHPDAVGDKETAVRHSLIGAHVLVEAHGLAFVSMVDPPEEAADLVAGCRQDRCWPVLTGAPGDTDLLLGSPIILYDYPEIAAESAGSLFDATEIDEILTLRVMTMTDPEKAEARATDPRARDIIDRCDAMSPDELQQLHGAFRDPRLPMEAPFAASADLAAGTSAEVPWWDPASDTSVDPANDSVVVDSVVVSRGSLVTVRPKRRADAQDLFFADRVARVTAVLSDVDGGTHVALVLVDDPAADMHEWYGRYFYFAPEEIEPLEAERKENRS